MGDEASTKVEKRRSLSGLMCLANGGDMTSIWGCRREAFTEMVVRWVVLRGAGLWEEGKYTGGSNEEGRAAGLGRMSL